MKQCTGDSSESKKFLNLFVFLSHVHNNKGKARYHMSDAHLQLLTMYGEAQMNNATKGGLQGVHQQYFFWGQRVFFYSRPSPWLDIFLTYIDSLFHIYTIYLTKIYGLCQVVFRNKMHQFQPITSFMSLSVHHRKQNLHLIQRSAPLWLFMWPTFFSVSWGAMLYSSTELEKTLDQWRLVFPDFTHAAKVMKLKTYLAAEWLCYSHSRPANLTLMKWGEEWWKM